MAGCSVRGVQWGSHLGFAVVVVFFVFFCVVELRRSQSRVPVTGPNRIPPRTSNLRRARGGRTMYGSALMLADTEALAGEAVKPVSTHNRVRTHACPMSVRGLL